MKNVGRNDPCTCGSGRKFKHCCGRDEGRNASRPSTAPSIEEALRLHRSGRLAEAAALYQDVLDQSPNHPDALHYLGLVAHQTGKSAAAVELIGKAVSLDPTSGKLCNLGLALNAQGRKGDAIESFRKALVLQPDCDEACNGLGSVYQAQGRLAEAMSCYRKAISLNDRNAEAHNNLGGVLKALGNFDEAIRSYRRALEINAIYPEALSNLGIALQARGDLDEAATRYRSALSLRPDLANARYNLGVVLQRQGRLQDAIDCFREAIETAPRMAEARLALAGALAKQGEWNEALAHYGSALEISPGSVAPHVEMSRLLDLLVPPWHVPMMNDVARNEAYRTALAAAITPDSHVLEIGTGAGLLAMMAARQGARCVTTCEAQPIIADAARTIIARNGFETQVKIVPKKSQELRLPDDLAERADLLVTEIFSSELLAEHALPSIEDARRRLLKPGAQIIPASASVMIALFGGEQIGKNYAVSRCCGFDLAPFNFLVPRKHVVARNDLPFEWLSADVEAFRFEFERPGEFPEETKALRVRASGAGACYGVIQWIKLQLDAVTVFENHPRTASAASGWQHCIYLFEHPVSVNAEDVVVLCAKHDRVWPWFTLEGVEPMAGRYNAAC